MAQQRKTTAPAARTGETHRVTLLNCIDTENQATVIYQGPCRTDVQVARRRIDVCQAATLTIEPGWTPAPNLGKAS